MIEKEVSQEKDRIIQNFLDERINEINCNLPSNNVINQIGANEESKDNEFINNNNYMNIDVNKPSSLMTSENDININPSNPLGKNNYDNFMNNLPNNPKVQNISISRGSSKKSVLAKGNIKKNYEFQHQQLSAKLTELKNKLVQEKIRKLDLEKQLKKVEINEQKYDNLFKQTQKDIKKNENMFQKLEQSEAIREEQEKILLSLELEYYELKKYFPDRKPLQFDIPKKKKKKGKVGEKTVNDEIDDDTKSSGATQTVIDNINANPNNQPEEQNKNYGQLKLMNKLEDIEERDSEQNVTTKFFQSNNKKSSNKVVNPIATIHEEKEEIVNSDNLPSNNMNFNVNNDIQNLNSTINKNFCPLNDNKSVKKNDTQSINKGGIHKTTSTNNLTQKNLVKKNDKRPSTSTTKKKLSKSGSKYKTGKANSISRASAKK